MRDSGEGIEERLKAQVFDLFFTTRESGTGLGLPMVRRIVEQHGGSISLISARGRGTTVTLTLPTGT